MGVKHEFQVGFVKFVKIQPFLGIFRENGWFFENLKKFTGWLGYVIYMVFLDENHEFQVSLIKFSKFQPFLRIFRAGGWFFENVKKYIGWLGYVIYMVFSGRKHETQVSFTKFSTFQPLPGILQKMSDFVKKYIHLYFWKSK